MPHPTLWNRLWLWRHQRDHQHFMAGLGRVRHTQEALLSQYLARNADTDFGRAHCFARLRGYADYAAQVPLAEDYEALRPYVAAIAQGRQRVLTAASVQCFESTSGTSGLAKWIPYTQTLKDEFQRAVGIWMHELRRAHPGAFAGRAYWSISPPLKAPETTPGGLQVGMTSDTAYFNPLVAWLLGRIMAVPQAPATTDAHEFYLHTCRRLLACEDLSFISVWSPNYFLQLHGFLTGHLGEILEAPGLSRRRREALRDFSWARAFPKLAVLSCWTDAQAAIWVPEVRLLLGGRIALQPKGLLSTEGVTTLPLADGTQGLAYTAHVFEFRELDSGHLCLADGLTVGGHYEVVLTTGGGLYRYCTRDVVVCEGFRKALPLLRFAGKSGEVSDLVGEKVAATTLYPFFEAVRSQHPHIRGLFLHPKRMGRAIVYRLVVEADGPLDTTALAEQAEAFLSGNPYYRQCRAVGQLGHAEAAAYPLGLSVALFADYRRRRGIKDGDAKLPLLLPLDWAEAFFRE